MPFLKITGGRRVRLNCLDGSGWATEVVGMTGATGPNDVAAGAGPLGVLAGIGMMASGHGARGVI